MKNILMILAHPDLKKSIGNRVISDFLSDNEEVKIRDLTSLYPDFRIDVEAEQQALLKADLIIFQYPLFWYNVPAILKEWIDQVFQYGFAFGIDGYLLEGKKIIVSFTMGSSKKDYPQEVIDKILFPFQGLAKYCKMDYCGEVLSNEINNYTKEGEKKAKKIAHKHAEEIVKIINSYDLVTS